MPQDALIRGKGGNHLCTIRTDLPIGHQIRLDHALRILDQKGARAKGIVVHAAISAALAHQGTRRNRLGNTNLQFFNLAARFRQSAGPEGQCQNQAEQHGKQFFHFKFPPRLLLRAQR